MRIISNGTDIKGKVSLPGSKSISNRILLLQALSGSKYHIENLSMSNDTHLMEKGLKALSGIENMVTVDCEDAGTVLRFLLAYCAIQEGKKSVLSGTQVLLQRPIDPLIKALQHLGADISRDSNGNIHIEGQKLKGGELQIHTDHSSQFVSALCMIAPYMQDGLTLRLEGEMVSMPYVEMTLKLMADAGVKSQWDGDVISIKAGRYHAECDFRVESDWSSASYYYAMACIADKLSIDLAGLLLDSVQGDAYVVELGVKYGITTEAIEGGIRIQKSHEPSANSLPLQLDFKNYPDLAVPFIVACAIKYPSTRIVGINHLVYKESNRIAVLKSQLQKCGIALLFEQNCIYFKKEHVVYTNALLPMETFKDHRIAMSLALCSMLGRGIEIDDAQCVRKSYPCYWAQLASLNFSVF